MDKGKEKALSMPGGKRDSTRALSQSRRLRSIAIAGALTLDLATPAISHAGGFYEELASGDCLYTGSTTNGSLLRICNTSDFWHPDSETDNIMGPQGTIGPAVIPENLGVKTNFMWTMGWESRQLAGISLSLPYVRRVLIVTDQ